MKKDAKIEANTKRIFDSEFTGINPDEKDFDVC